MAKSIMIQGTMSNAGKSLIAAGLCRIFKQDGYKVAPFKSQNMALNSYVTSEGLEMGRAQVVQAMAAGVEPSVRMNPILLKPTTDMGSQVIVQGQVVGNMRAMDYFAKKKEYIPVIRESYEQLAADHDIIVIEGAGSPAEINLKQDDIVNMGYSGTFSSDVVKEEYTDAELVDSIANEDIYVSYEIPENFILLRDDQTGKSYYSEADKSQVIVSVIPYTWKSAADMAEDSNSAGISKVTAEGQYEEKGKIYYYYAYSILRIRNGTRKTSYYFNAYTDLEDGNIYSINGFADDSPEIMNPKTYTRFMSITEE